MSPISNGVRNGSSVPLTLCSLKGNVELNSIYREHEFAAIALFGTLKNGGSDPVRLKGAMAVDTLSPAELRHGGELTYESRLDPTIPGYRQYYRAFIGDSDVKWILP